MVKASVRERPETHFSWLRTRLSVERTMMSWVRTSTAMIGFGFTIYQFFDRFNQMQGVAPPRHPNAIRFIALSLVGLGTLCMLMALTEYRTMVRYLWSEEYRGIAGMDERPHTTPLIYVAVLLAAVGLFTFVALVTRAVG